MSAPLDLPFVSVVIPVYCPLAGPAHELDQCLDHLARQTYPRERFEVIVVDNGCPSIDASLRRHDACHAPALDLQLVREPRPGSYAARNAGLRVARGTVLAFTDADCLPWPDWIEQGVKSVAEGSETGIVAGRIQLVEPRPAGVSPTAYLYSSMLSFAGNKGEKGEWYGATADLIVRRAIMDAVGPFDTAFLSGGDWDWGRRAKALGFATRYVAAVGVWHQARPSIGSILRRELRLAGGVQTARALRHPASRLRNARNVLGTELRRVLPWALSVVRGSGLDAPPAARAKVSALVVLVQALRTAERLRVLLGGAPRRA